VFYGPPGCGKTSFAEVIARVTGSRFVRVNAVMSNVGELREILGAARRRPSEPTLLFIDELHRFGWNVKPTVKGADSVNSGIDILKRHKLFVTPRSSNLIKELQNYKWVEDKNGNLLNKPISAFDHGIDAARYAVANKLSKPNYGRYNVR
jgi:phage terminase large subunit